MSPYQGDSPSDQGEQQPDQQRGYQSTPPGQGGRPRGSQQGGVGQRGGTGQQGGAGQQGPDSRRGGRQQSDQPGGFQQSGQQGPSQFGSSQWSQQPQQRSRQSRRPPGQGSQQPSFQQGGGGHRQGQGGHQQGQPHSQYGQGGHQQGQPHSQHGQGGQLEGQGGYQQTGGTTQQQPMGSQPQSGGTGYAQQPASFQGGGLQSGQPGTSQQVGSQSTQPGMGGQQGTGSGQSMQRQSGPQLRPITVEEIVQGDPVTVEPDTPVTTIVAKMDEEDVGSVIVIEDGRPTGIVTDRKIAMAIERYETVAELTAEDLVTGDIVTATSENTVFEVLGTLREEGVRRLPVVDEDGQLQGVVTLDDLIVLLATEIGNVGETIQAQIERL